MNYAYEFDQTRAIILHSNNRCSKYCSSDNTYMYSVFREANRREWTNTSKHNVSRKGGKRQLKKTLIFKHVSCRCLKTTCRRSSDFKIDAIIFLQLILEYNLHFNTVCVKISTVHLNYCITN